MDPSPTLTIVLPAYNEAGRIEPALDELFGYLRRRGASARDGAPGAAELPGRIDVLVVDDGSTDGTADLVRARPETRDAQAGATLSVLSVPHGGKGAAVRAGMLHARTRPDRLRRRGHGDAAGHAGAARRGAGGRGRRARQPDPARRLGHAEEPAALPAAARQGVPSPRVGVGRRAGPGHPVRVQGLPAGRGPRPVQPAEDHEHRLRRRADLSRPATRLRDRDRADHAGPTGAARGCAPGRRSPPASRGTCSGSRCSTAGSGGRRNRPRDDDRAGAHGRSPAAAPTPSTCPRGCRRSRTASGRPGCGRSGTR